MNCELISIVVPIYDVEEFLPRCLDSIIGQTYQNIEIILVDDGSPDNAGLICNNYTKLDCRISVYHLHNRGVANARLYGVEHSNGKYIVFVDPDDWVSPTYVETLYSHMNDDVDIVACGFTRVDRRVGHIYTLRNEIISSDEYIHRLLVNEIYKAPWGKIFRRSSMTLSCFHSVIRGQDFLMNLEIATHTKTISLIDHTLYYYCHRDNPAIKRITTSFEFKKDFYNKVITIIDSYDLLERYQDELFHLAMEQIYSLLATGVQCSADDDWIKSVLESSKGMKLSFRAKLICFAIKHPRLQHLFYYCRESVASIYRRAIKK